jgi:ribose transport system permease protein
MPAEKIAVIEDIDELLIKKARRKDMVRNVLPFFGLIFTIVLLTVATHGLLLSSQNLVNIINQCFTNALVGVGAAFVYAYGGMDFSLGAACGLAQVVFIGSFMRYNTPIWAGIILAILTCVIATMIVGAGSHLLHLQPFIVSLCVRSVCGGLLEAGNNSMGGKIVVPMETFGFFNNNLLKAIILAVALFICWFLFEKTKLGKEAKLIGGNRVTAWQSGIRPFRVIVLAHLLLGIMVGIAACFTMVRNGMVSSGSGGALEFNIMIAMALGGFPMEGGAAAKIRSVIIGVLTMTILTNGLTIAGVDNSLINITKGVLFVVIVALSYDRTNLKQVVFM